MNGDIEALPADDGFELGNVVTHPSFANGEALGVVVVVGAPKRVRVAWAGGDIMEWYDGYRGDVMPTKVPPKQRNVTP